MSDQPVIYVQLIEEQPLSPFDYEVRYPDKGYEQLEEMYVRYLDRFQPWRWISFSGENQKKMGRSTERYFNRGDAIHAIELLFGPDSIVYRQESEKGDELVRHPEPWPAA